MSFEQDPNEQAQISGSDLALLTGELKTAQVNLALLTGAVKNLLTVKGRYHGEKAFNHLVAIYNEVSTPPDQQ